MSIVGVQSGAYADLGDAWLQDQSSRLKQKRLQFGRHYRIDGDALLARSAQVARAARAAAAAAESYDLAPDRIRRAMIEAIEQCSWSKDPFAQKSRLLNGADVARERASTSILADDLLRSTRSSAVPIGRTAE